MAYWKLEVGISFEYPLIEEHTFLLADAGPKTLGGVFAQKTKVAEKIRVNKNCHVH